MILSASRRTDIPNYYADWFYNRIREGFLYVKNPMNDRQVSRIELSPEIVDCIVFWTKNPVPMLKRLDELKEYTYYFQFSLTGYGHDIEPFVPHKKDRMIPAFQELSNRIGVKRVIWRYDPILFNDVYTMEYHKKAFAQIARSLEGYTKKCVISFVDRYAKNKKSMDALHAQEPDEEALKSFARDLSAVAHASGMEIATCAERIDLEDCGIAHNCCIDPILIEELLGCGIKAAKDKYQRAECGCMESVDIGSYDTCRNGCKYCYANRSAAAAEKNSLLYDADSPLLCGKPIENDWVTERKLKSIKNTCF